MAKIELPCWIKSVSGRIGDYIFSTRNGKTYVYYKPKNKYIR